MYFCSQHLHGSPWFADPHTSVSSPLVAASELEKCNFSLFAKGDADRLGIEVGFSAYGALPQEWDQTVEPIGITRLSSAGMNGGAPLLLPS